jgi:hypothetical protein
MAYDESDDNTLELLNQQKNIISNMDILINPNPTTQIRTQNIANARNAILNKIKESYTPEWKYFIMIDCDDVCEYNIDTNTLSKYLTRYDWDSLSFNRKCYYDTWALSFDPYIFSCWNWPNAREVIDIMNAVLEKKLSSLKKNELFECYSAFNGFAIYRTSKFLDCTYEWETPINLITKEQLDKNVKAVGTNPFIRPNNDDCEHRSFHLQAIIKNQAKIMISPLCLFDN